MGQKFYDESDIQNIANAIRSKNGTQNTYTVAQMAGAVSNIPTGVTPTGSVTLTANGTYDVTDKASAVVAVASNYKVFSFTSQSAVANTTVKVVSGDPDVAAHYSDTNAMVTIRKITNNNSNGLAFLMATNHPFPTTYGVYQNYNLTNNNAGVIGTPLATAGASGNIWVAADSNGDINVGCKSQQNNFGGANYIITFSW